MPKINLTEIIGATNAEVINKVDNIIFTDIVTDSRKIVDGSLFVALKGENFNGEDFAIDAISKGATGILINNNCDTEKIPSTGVILKVSDTLKAYQQIAHMWRMKFDIPIVAITGSNGKTTTKDLTAAVLSSLGKVQKTSSNFNNEIGVPLTLLGIDDDNKSAVVEIGMRGLHQIEELAKIVKPTIGIVTNVGETHIELLGSIENIAQAKGELVEAIEADGTVILNVDNSLFDNLKSRVKPGVNIITFGINNDANIRAYNIVTGAASTIFTVQYNGNNYDCEIPILGKHNVSNALAAIAVGVALKIKIEDILKSFATLSTTKMRFEIIEHGNVHIINDAYNASPASMRAAIQTTAEIASGRKIAVLGDMLELGNIAERVHREIGDELVKNNFSILITLGTLGKFIAEGAKNSGVETVYTAGTHEEAAEILQRILKTDDTILFKGSRGMQMEKIIKLI